MSYTCTFIQVAIHVHHRPWDNWVFFSCQFTNLMFLGAASPIEFKEEVDLHVIYGSGH